MKMLRVFCVSATVLVAAISTFPQTDSAGTAPSTKVRSPAKPSKPTGPIPLKHVPTSGGSTKPATQPRNAGISISVSEPEAEITLTDRAGKSVFDTDSRVTDGDKTPVEIEDLKAGPYVLTVRKQGYFDERRTVTVVGGRPNYITVNLRPSAAFLSVFGNTEGTTITIDGLGTFQGELRGQAVKPGAYDVKVSKKGYISDSKAVQLDLPGQESTVIFNLRPVPIVELLVEAEAALGEQKLDRVIELCSQVLELDPNLRKANVMIGKAYFQKARTEAGAYLVHAMDLGEIITLPVKIFDTNGEVQLVSGEIILHKGHIQFRSEQRPDLDFLLAKTQLTSFQKSQDDRKMSYITYGGNGMTKGLAKDRSVVIYSTSSALQMDRSGVFCPPAGDNSGRCDAEIDIVATLVAAWRNRSN